MRRAASSSISAPSKSHADIVQRFERRRRSALAAYAACLLLAGLLLTAMAYPPPWSLQLAILVALVVSTLWFRIAYRCPTCATYLGRPVEKHRPPFSPARCPRCGVRLR